MLDFQGCARCATGVACKSLSKKKVQKKYVRLYIYLNPLENAISIEPICLPEKGF